MQVKVVIPVIFIFLFSLNATAQASVDGLTEKQLTEFQNEGIRKLQDFYDLLSVISNKAYEKSMREDAEAQAKKLFYGTECSIDGKRYKNYIDSCFNVRDRIQWKAVNISVKEKIHSKSDVLDGENYEGTVTFTLSGTNSRTRIADIVLAKKKKTRGLGDDEIWTALIGGIR